MAFVVIEPDELRARLAMRIRETAKRRRMTLSKLAEDSGVSPGHLWAVLRGEKAPTSDVLAKFAAVLQVDPHELVRPPRKARAPK